jgi:hypothetical protein
MYTDPKTRKLVGNLFPIIGLGLLLCAIASAISTQHFIKSASRAEGKVIKLYAGGAHPEIRFVPAGEPAIEFSGHGFIDYAVGDKVNVLYLKDPQTPAGYQIQIDTPGALWSSTSLFTYLGISFVIGGLYTKHIYKPNA